MGSAVGGFWCLKRSRGHRNRTQTKQPCQ